MILRRLAEQLGERSWPAISIHLLRAVAKEQP